MNSLARFILYTYIKGGLEMDTVFLIDDNIIRMEENISHNVVEIT